MWMNHRDNMLAPLSLPGGDAEIIILQGLRELSVILPWVGKAGKTCCPLTTKALATSALAIWNETGIQNL